MRCSKYLRDNKVLSFTAMLSPIKPFIFESSVMVILASSISPSNTIKYPKLTSPPEDFVVRPSIKPLVKNGVARLKSDKIITKKEILR